MTHLIPLALLLAAQPSVDELLGDPPGPDPAAETKAKADGDEAVPEPVPPDDPAAKAQPKQEPAEPESEEPAEPETAADDSDEGSAWAWLDDMTRSGAIGLIRKGGFFMWPILIAGIVAAGVIIERWRSLKMLNTDSGAIRSEVQELLEQDRIEEALTACDREQGPVPAILGSGLRKYLVLRRLNYDPGKIEEQVVKAMDDYSVHVVAALERHLSILATISSAAPMLGFLGTVQGMIVSFEDIVAMMGETNIVEAAAAGISVALLTTCFGLIIGIPAFVAFNYFTSVINRFVLEVEESATELIEAVTLQLAIAGRSAETDEAKSPDGQPVPQSAVPQEA